MPDEFLDRLGEQAREPGWTEWLRRPAPAAAFVAVGEHGRIGAYCAVDTVRVPRDDLPGLRVGELVALYADPEAWSTGAGHAACQAGTDHLIAQGFERAVLWVLRENLTARRFYERHGWSDDGVLIDLTISGRRIPEIRYSRSLERA